MGPLLAERRHAFVAKAEALGSDRRTKAERLKLLAPFDPAEAFVSLRLRPGDGLRSLPRLSRGLSCRRGAESHRRRARAGFDVYALFVERAARLIRADGIVGLLTPSGIAADKGAAPFFAALAPRDGWGRCWISRTGARLSTRIRSSGRGQPFQILRACVRRARAALLASGLRLLPAGRDGGRGGGFPADARGLRHREPEHRRPPGLRPAARPSRPDESSLRATIRCSRAATSTGTAPVFRSPRDAEITRGIYQRLPVLVDRRGPQPRAVWPVR